MTSTAAPLCTRRTLAHQRITMHLMQSDALMQNPNTASITSSAFRQMCDAAGLTTFRSFDDMSCKEENPVVKTYLAATGATHDNR